MYARYRARATGGKKGEKADMVTAGIFWVQTGYAKKSVDR